MTFHKTFRSDQSDRHGDCRSSWRRGFTLIELLLVISILAILSALGVSVLSSAEQDALETRTKAGIERISNVMNRKLEANAYRILPVRMPAGSEPKEIREFRVQAMAEFLRVEFPFVLAQIDDTLPISMEAEFPQNKRLNMTDPMTKVEENMGQGDRPQIASRYVAKLQLLSNPPSVQHQSAELLYAILSLNYDEFGQPLTAILREREIGDVDVDGHNEVLDAFGDPLDFSLRIKLSEQELDDFADPNTPDTLPIGAMPMGRLLIVRSELHDAIGYEAILDPDFILDSNNPDHVGLVNVGLLQHVARKLVNGGPIVRDPDHKLAVYEMFPSFEKYRITIRSANLTTTDSGAVVTQ